MAGEVRYNPSKFKELVLYLSQRSNEDEGFGMVKLNKLLYRADFEAFRQLGQPITGAEYEKQEFGPVARPLPLALDDLARVGHIIWHQIPAGPHTRKVPEAKEQPDTTLFNEQEIAIIDRALAELSRYGGKGVSEWSHEQSAAWRAAEIGQQIPYGAVFISNRRLSKEQMQRALRRSREEGWAAIRP